MTKQRHNRETQHPKSGSSEDGISRRDAMKRGAALGGALVWATPVVKTFTANPAHATGEPADDEHAGGSGATRRFESIKLVLAGWFLPYRWGDAGVWVRNGSPIRRHEFAEEDRLPAVDASPSVLWSYTTFETAEQDHVAVQYLPPAAHPEAELLALEAFDGRRWMTVEATEDPRGPTAKKAAITAS